MKPDFSKAQNEATKLLLKQEFDSLYIDVRNFKFDKNIYIDSIQHYSKIVGENVSNFTCSELSGCLVLKIYNFNIILYDDFETNKERKHWGIVHEIGHIYLEHTSDGAIEEIEANFFAAQIVMPEPILRYIVSYKGSFNVTEIYENFNVSYEAAFKRINTLNKNVSFYSKSIDYDILIKKFEPIIKNKFARNNSFICAI